MTNERRQDVILIATVISVVLHVALMFWARPQVMTRVTSSRRVPKHGPVTVREAPPLLVPKAVDLFTDESAHRDAPSAEGTSSAPTADEALPMPSGEVALSVPEAPSVEAKLATEELVAEAKPVELPVAVSDPVPVAASAAEKPAFMSYGGSDLVVSIPAPEVSAPAVGILPAAAPRSALSVSSSSVQAEYVVPKEVLELVDERFVEREKAAVRQLIDVADARDLTKAVAVRLEKASAGGWTYFRATVTPKAELAPVPKDVVVLLDASGSIGRDRLESCRKAAKRILRSCTNTGDRFNLVAFRDRFSYAFKTWQACDASSFATADWWLERLASHGRTDVFATIRSVLTLPRDPKRPLIAMVVTDGDANEGVKETKAILSKFTALNDGLVSVYMYGVRRSANRELIDVLTRGNRGESLVYEDWKAWHAGEGLEGLSERFRDPLVTDLRVVFASPLRAEAYPTALKNLYRGNSVTITGRVPGSPASIDFSLKGLAGDVAYEGFFRLPLASAAANASLPGVFANESSLAAQVR